MTNFEFYNERLNTTGFGLVKGKPVECCDMDYMGCGVCDWELIDCGCDCIRQAWLKEEYVEPLIDWSTVEVDTPILVSTDGEQWFKRYFARYKKGKVYAWCAGASSWSKDDDNDVVWWYYAELAEVEND